MPIMLPVGVHKRLWLGAATAVLALTGAFGNVANGQRG